MAIVSPPPQDNLPIDLAVNLLFLDKLMRAGLSANGAAEFLATVTGAMVMATVAP